MKYGILAIPHSHKKDSTLLRDDKYRTECIYWLLYMCYIYFKKSIYIVACKQVKDLLVFVGRKNARLGAEVRGDFYLPTFTSFLNFEI